MLDLDGIERMLKLREKPRLDALRGLLPEPPAVRRLGDAGRATEAVSHNNNHRGGAMKVGVVCTELRTKDIYLTNGGVLEIEPTEVALEFLKELVKLVGFALDLSDDSEGNDS